MNVSRRGELLLFAATLCAASGWVTSKYVLYEMPNSMFVAGRFFIAATLLLPFCFQELKRISWSIFKNLIFVGALLAASINVWVHAVSTTNSLAEGAFIMSLAMIIAPLTQWLLLRQKPSSAFWVSLPLATVGMMFLTLKNGWNFDPSLGYFFLSSCLLSAHFVLNKRVSAQLSALPSICIQMFVVAISGAILYVIDGAPSIEVSTSGWFYFALATLLATTMRYLTQTIGQGTTSIATASLIMILEPIWTLLMSVALFGSHLSTTDTLGGALILLSLYVYVKRSSRHGN